MTEEMRRLRRLTPDRQHVYFVQGVLTRLVKIGVADNAAQRLRCLSRGSPDRLVVLGATICWDKGAMEKRLHAQFAPERQHGEWFLPSGRLLAFIEDHCAGANEPWTASLQAACDEPRKPKGRKPRANAA